MLIFLAIYGVIGLGFLTFVLYNIWGDWKYTEPGKMRALFWVFTLLAFLLWPLLGIAMIVSVVKDARTTRNADPTWDHPSNDEQVIQKGTQDAQQRDRLDR